MLFSLEQLLELCSMVSFRPFPRVEDRGLTLPLTVFLSRGHAPCKAMKHFLHSSLKFLLAILWGTFILKTDLHAQDSTASEKTPYWLGVSFGLENEERISLGVAYNTGHLWILHLGAEIANNSLGGKSETRIFVTGGRRLTHSYFSTTVSGGPSLISGKEFSNNFSKEPFTTIGLTTKVQSLLVTLPDFGIGTEVLANLNPKANIVGLRLIIAFHGNSFN